MDGLCRHSNPFLFRSCSMNVCSLENPFPPHFAWSLLGIKVFLDRAKGHGTEVDMGLGRNNEATLRNEGCNSRLALYYQSSHQHARAQKSSFPTSLGSGTFREWGGRGDSLCGES